MLPHVRGINTHTHTTPSNGNKRTKKEKKTKTTSLLSIYTSSRSVLFLLLFYFASHSLIYTLHANMMMVHLPTPLSPSPVPSFLPPRTTVMLSLRPPLSLPYLLFCPFFGGDEMRLTRRTSRSSFSASILAKAKRV